MRNDDVRWIQRLNNYELALTRLREAVTLSRERALSRLEQQGLIQGFEFTHELSWKVMKDFFADQDGTDRIGGSKDATRTALARGLIAHGELWMEMVESRNLSTHTYNEATANKVFKRVTESYIQLFDDFLLEMQSRCGR